MKNYSRKDDELWKNLFNFVARIEQLMKISYVKKKSILKK